MNLLHPNHISRIRPRAPAAPIAVQYCLYAAPVTGRVREEVVCDLMQVYTVESVPVTVDAVVMDAGAGQMSNWFEVEMSWRTGKKDHFGVAGFVFILNGRVPFASTTSRGNPPRTHPGTWRTQSRSYYR